MTTLVMEKNPITATTDVELTICSKIVLKSVEFDRWEFGIFLFFTRYHTMYEL